MTPGKAAGVCCWSAQLAEDGVRAAHIAGGGGLGSVSISSASWSVRRRSLRACAQSGRWTRNSARCHRGASSRSHLCALEAVGGEAAVVLAVDRLDHGVWGGMSGVASTATFDIGSKSCPLQVREGSALSAFPVMLAVASGP